MIVFAVFMCNCCVCLNLLAVGTFLMVVPLVSSIPHHFLDPHWDVSPVGTLKRRRPQQANQQLHGQRHYRQPRENYQMGQMRHWENGLLFALVLSSAYNGSSSLQKVTLLIFEKFKELDQVQWTKLKDFFGPNKLTLYFCLGARLAVVHTAFIVNNFSKEQQENNFCYVILMLYFCLPDWRWEKQRCASVLPLSSVCASFMFSCSSSYLSILSRAAIINIKAGLKI